MTLEFGRIITAMATPFDTDGTVSYSEAIRLGQHLVDNGTDTLLLAGTTGESPTLTHEEEFKLFSEMRAAFPAHKIIAGTGSNCTRTAIQSTQEAEALGVDGVLQVVPYYNRPSQEGCYQHFKAVANATQLPVILYNIPGRTGRNLEPETVARLAEIPNIIGIKESAGSVDQAQKIRNVTPPDFIIYSGDDALTLDFMTHGASGVISVASHIVGNQMQAMIKAFVSGNRTEARRIEAELMPIFEVLFITSNPTPLKAALRLQGFNVGIPRLPLVAATDTEIAQIREALIPWT